jgi:hypothetical protein
LEGAGPGQLPTLASISPVTGDKQTGRNPWHNNDRYEGRGERQSSNAPASSKHFAGTNWYRLRSVTAFGSGSCRHTAQGIIGSEVIEFWPDIVRHHRRKEAEKLARKNGVPSASQPARQPSSPVTRPSPED